MATPGGPGGVTATPGATIVYSENANEDLDDEKETMQQDTRDMDTAEEPAECEGNETGMNDAVVPPADGDGDGIELVYDDAAALPAEPDDVVADQYCYPSSAETQVGGGGSYYFGGEYLDNCRTNSDCNSGNCKKRSWMDVGRCGSAAAAEEEVGEAAVGGRWDYTTSCTKHSDCTYGWACDNRNGHCHTGSWARNAEQQVGNLFGEPNVGEAAVGVQVKKIMDCYRSGGHWVEANYSYCSRMEAKEKAVGAGSEEEEECGRCEEMKDGECTRIPGCLTPEEIDDLPENQKTCIMSYSGNIRRPYYKDRRGVAKDGWCQTSHGWMRCGGGALCCKSGVPVLGSGYTCSGAEAAVD